MVFVLNDEVCHFWQFGIKFTAKVVIMKLKDSLIVLLSVAFVIFAMFFIQVYLPKHMKDTQACYSVYLKK